jgi:hypothetical protein
LNPEFRSQNPGEEQTAMTGFVIAASILNSGSWLLNSRNSIKIFESRIQKSESRRRANSYDRFCHCSIYSEFWLLAPEFPEFNKHI